MILEVSLDMNLHGKDIKIFAGNSNLELAEEIAQKIGLPLGESVVDVSAMVKRLSVSTNR